MITENTKAILLLTTYFNTNEVREYKPLNTNGYGYFACWLRCNGFQPSDLLSEDIFDNVWAIWSEAISHAKAKTQTAFHGLDKTIEQITYERIKELLNRGASLSLALDKWLSAGIWIMDRKHSHYPKSVLKQLKHQSPAILFGVGNSELLTKPAIGFVGSRDCDTDDEQATNHYVEQINQLNYQVVSGGAKGVDTHSMLASLNNGNTAIGILSDSLFRASASSQWRQHLKANNLVLISPFFPEDRFSPANAMARNKFIYLLSNATVVITSGEKGGTWSGAKENLKKDWVPLLVSAHQQPLQAGNQALINGSGLGKTTASALSISPTIPPEQFSELILNTNQSVQEQGERVNQTGSLLSDPIPTPNNIDNTVEHNINNASNINAQDDMFSMQDSFEQETLIPDQAVNAVKTKVATESVQPKLIQNISADTELQLNEIADTVTETRAETGAKTQTFPTEEREESIASNHLEGEVERAARVDESVEELTEQSQNSSVPTPSIEESELHELAPQQLSEQQSATPLLDNFYQQLCALIELQPQQIIDKTVIDSHFPEFEIMGKQALDKWLKHLVEQDKLVKPHARKKQYTLPK